MDDMSVAGYTVLVAASLVQFAVGIIEKLTGFDIPLAVEKWLERTVSGLLYGLAALLIGLGSPESVPAVVQ